MKSEVKIPASITEKPFPKLMKNEYGVVVLFTDRTTGTCVSVGEGACSLGLTSSTWDYPQFTDFEGTVTLSND